MSSSFRLKKSAIHVWPLCLDVSEKEYQQLKQFLNSEEQSRAQRYKHKKAQQQFISARGQLKYILASYLQTTPGSIRFDIGQYGKPRLAGSEIDCGLVFNLSHCGSVALVAIAQDCALGVDIEHVNSRHNLESMALRCFSDEELSVWQQLPDEQKIAGFYDYWCAKEAFLKACGRGLALGMERCQVNFDQCCFTRLPEKYLITDWQLFRIDVGGDYRAFVVGNGNSETLEMRCLEEGN